MIVQEAKWISLKEYKKASALLRKEFTLEEDPSHAELSVCGLGYGVVTFNGKKITEDVLTTIPSRFDQTVYYSTYDVTKLLHKGNNAAGVFLGNGWYNDVSESWYADKGTWRHHPKLLFSLCVEFPSGKTVRIVSDTSWKGAPGPAVYNHSRCGERYDARLMPHGFDCPLFDDSEWDRAQICRSPGGILKKADIPPIRIIRTMPLTEIFPSVYDVGQNISGWVRIHVKGIRGWKIRMEYSERVTETGELDTKNINAFTPPELQHCDEYFCEGTGDWETWEPSFCYHGFRYVRVIGAPKEFQMEACLVHTDLQSVGEFSCSDDMINRIHSASRWSTLTNFHAIPTDCPHREQNGWTGDAQLSCEQALMNFDMTAVYRRWLNDFRDVQRPSGQLPGIVPSPGWGYNWGSGPAWDSALILIPLYVWRYTGNDCILRDVWDCMERYMDYLSSMEDHGIVNFGLGDWCPPESTIPCPTELTDTAYYYADAMAMAEGACVLGHDPSPYDQLAKRVRTAFREKFIRNGLPVPEGQTSLACVIFQGLLEPHEQPAAASRLAELVRENGFHIDCGILGTKYIFRALSDFGYDETLYQMITNPTGPSYANWILHGMTTLCETWSMNESLNHHMFSEVDLWFYRSLAGIRADGAELVIAPSFLNQLSWVKASHRGISVYWDQNSITVTVPEKATLILPDRTLPLEPGTTTIQR